MLKILHLDEGLRLQSSLQEVIFPLQKTELIHFQGSEVHPKSKWKVCIKREWLQLGGYFFLEFLKASIADLVTLLFSSLQNSEGSGNGDSGDSFADPCQFLPFLKTKI